MVKEDPDLLPKPSIRIGKSRRLSLPRRLVCDLLHFAKKVPSIPVQRRMNVQTAVTARARTLDRPGWVVIFAKAFALAALEIPELRCCYLPFPFPRIYQHPKNVVNMAVTREYEGEEAVFFTHVPAPESTSLEAFQRHVNRCKTVPLGEYHSFQLVLMVSRLWNPFRRWLWWIALNVSGTARSKLFGTFGVSVYSGTGSESLHPIAPLGFVLTYGPIDAKGNVDVRIVYDHRICDGRKVAEALKLIEQKLNGAIAAELDSMPQAIRMAA